MLSSHHPPPHVGAPNAPRAPVHRPDLRRPPKLTPDDRVAVELVELPVPEAARRLVALPFDEAARALSRLDATVAGPLLAHLPLDVVTALLDRVTPARRPTLLSSLCPQRATWAHAASCYRPESAARLLSDGFVRATPETPAAAARARFAASPWVVPPARDLVVVDAGGRLLGVVARPLLDAAPPEQPVGALAQATPGVAPTISRSELQAILARDELDALPVVRETGALLGVVRRATLGQVAPTAERQRSSLGTEALAALILITLVLAGLSTLDPPLHERFLVGLG